MTRVQFLVLVIIEQIEEDEEVSVLLGTETQPCKPFSHVYVANGCAGAILHLNTSAGLHSQSGMELHVYIWYIH